MVFFLIFLDFQKNPFCEWFVRTLSGESESIFEGIYALKRRILHKKDSMAEAYGWGKFLGMTFPWIIDFVSRISGINIYGIQGFYIPYFYALSDQIGANISGMIFLRKKTGNWKKTINLYIQNPVMVSSFIIILIVPFGLLFIRFLGFSPSTQVFTALETIAAIFFWVPPLVGWLREKF